MNFSDFYKTQAVGKDEVNNSNREIIKIASILGETVTIVGYKDIVTSKGDGMILQLKGTDAILFAPTVARTRIHDWAEMDGFADVLTKGIPVMFVEKTSKTGSTYYDMILIK